MKDSEYHLRYRLQQKCGVMWRDIASSPKREPLERVRQNARDPELLRLIDKEETE